MTRTLSVSTITGRSIERHRVPKDGSQLRQGYDLLTKYPGQPVDLNFFGRNLNGALSSLRDFYGLDLRPLRTVTRKNNSCGVYFLAGEEIDGKYVDYVAPKVEQ